MKHIHDAAVKNSAFSNDSALFLAVYISLLSKCMSAYVIKECDVLKRQCYYFGDDTLFVQSADVKLHWQRVWKGKLTAPLLPNTIVKVDAIEFFVDSVHNSILKMTYQVHTKTFNE